MTASDTRKSTAFVRPLIILAVLLATLFVLLTPPAGDHGLGREVAFCCLATVLYAASRLVDALCDTHLRERPVGRWAGYGRHVAVREAKAAVAGCFLAWLLLAWGERLARLVGA